jgi:hypothetical protein
MEEKDPQEIESTPEEDQAPPAELDQEKLNRFQHELEMNQNLPMGIVAGLVASLIGAGVWAGITVGTGYQIGWIAVGVGFLVGIAVRQFGKGITNIFGIVGAALALFGCLLGNLLSFCIVIAQQEEIAFMEVVGTLNVSVIVELFKVTFSAIDLLFYGIAIYEGYKFSFRQVSQEELAELVSSPESNTS